MSAKEDRAAEAERRLQEHVRRVVDEAPPLTEEQRGRIAALLRGGEGRR